MNEHLTDPQADTDTRPLPTETATPLTAEADTPAPPAPAAAWPEQATQAPATAHVLGKGAKIALVATGAVLFAIASFGAGWGARGITARFGAHQFVAQAPASGDSSGQGYGRNYGQSPQGPTTGEQQRPGRGPRGMSPDQLQSAPDSDGSNDGGGTGWHR